MSVRDLPTKNNLIKLQAFIKQSKQGHKLLEQKKLILTREHDKYRKTHKDFTLQRYKGLGEMDASQLWETTLNPESRCLKRVEIEDARLANEMTELLMGSDVEPRREFIHKHGRGGWQSCVHKKIIILYKFHVRFCRNLCKIVV